MWDFDRNPDQYGNFGGQITQTAYIAIDNVIQMDVQNALHSGTPHLHGITFYPHEISLEPVDTNHTFGNHGMTGQFYNEIYMDISDYIKVSYL